MTLRNNKVLSIALIVVGALLALVSLATGGWISVVAGAVLAILGTLMTINPMVVFTETEVQVRNPAGFTLRRFPVSGSADIRVEGSKLVHVPTGKRITSLGFGVDKADANQVRAWASGSAPQT